MMIVQTAWRSVVVGVTYLGAVVVGGGLVQAMGWAPPDVPGTDPVRMLAGALLAGVIYAAILGPIVRRLGFGWWGRAAVVFLSVYVISNLVNVMEAVFFTTMPRPAVEFILVHDLITALVLGAVTATLFRPAADGSATAPTRVPTDRSPAAWAWRFVLSGLAYVPIYIVFGMIAYSFVAPYYQSQSSIGGWELRVPGWDIILPLECVRGLLMTAALLPIVLAWRESRWSLALWLGLVLAGLGSWAGMAQADFMAPMLRIVHGLEITADGFLHAAVIACLLGRPSRRTVEPPIMPGTAAPAM